MQGKAQSSVVTRLLVIGLGVGMSILFPKPAAAEDAPTRIELNLTDVGRPFGGWGTSLAWWANGVGQWPDATVDQIVDRITDPQNGLGLNVFRYNIGGGDQPGHHHMRTFADVPGFKATADAPYDWASDAAQRSVLLKLVAKSHDQVRVEGFSNSAPWWMTVSGCVAGSADGSANLKKDFEKPFADYLIDVTEHYRQQYNLTFWSLEPFNEPDVDWWRAGKDQEGMHVPRDQQARIFQLLRTGLDQRQLQAVKVSGTDANSIDDCLRSVNSFTPDTLSSLGQINTHSYYGTRRTQLAAAAQKLDKPIWLSETGPLNVGGSEYEQLLKMAQRIVVDINELRPEVWCMWQAVAGGPWGCLHDNPKDRTFRVAKGFYVYGAFTQAIRPGDRFINLQSDRAVAAISPTDQAVALVIVNPDNDIKRYEISLTHQRAEFPKQARVAVTDLEHDLEPRSAVQIDQGKFTIAAEPRSITRITLNDNHP